MTFPVSIKGVVLRAGRVLLLRNDRGEWELPGGRLEVGETPEQCVAREIAEETGWRVTTGRILDAWTYEVLPGRHVLIVTYGCVPERGQDSVPPAVSAEHSAAGLFAPADVERLRMPTGYKRSVASWCAALGGAEVSGWAARGSRRPSWRRRR
jgi:8-oxo-dGTP pyrophosphatase MutT (NUDIX family)